MEGFNFTTELEEQGDRLIHHCNLEINYKDIIKSSLTFRIENNAINYQHKFGYDSYFYEKVENDEYWDNIITLGKLKKDITENNIKNRSIDIYTGHGSKVCTQLRLQTVKKENYLKLYFIPLSLPEQNDINEYMSINNKLYSENYDGTKFNIDTFKVGILDFIDKLMLCLEHSHTNWYDEEEEEYEEDDGEKEEEDEEDEKEEEKEETKDKKKKDNDDEKKEKKDKKKKEVQDDDDEEEKVVEKKKKKKVKKLIDEDELEDHELNFS